MDLIKTVVFTLSTTVQLYVLTNYYIPTPSKNNDSFTTNTNYNMEIQFDLYIIMLILINCN